MGYFFSMRRSPVIFDLREQSKKLERTLSPRKLYRRNATKNFNRTPSPSSTCSSLAPRAGSVDLPREVDRTEFCVDGNGSEVNSVIKSSGCRLNITHWEKTVLLGKGSFAAVYEGISSEGFFFAVKEVSLLEQGSIGNRSISCLEQEIDLLSQFEHENIVRYLGTDKDDSKLYIFLELVTQGSLASLYQKHHLCDSHVSNYTRQILQGLKYLHERNVIHRDIKCANILVASDGTVKLADFGGAEAIKLNELTACIGTALWMAPEVVNHKNKGYGLAADIWSLGCTVLEMLSGHVPYYPLELMQALFRIGKGEPPAIPDSLSGAAKDFIKQCLRVNPNNRPTAAELLEHPFVRRPLYASAGSESSLPGSR